MYIQDNLLENQNEISKKSEDNPVKFHGIIKKKRKLKNVEGK